MFQSTDRLYGNSLLQSRRLLPMATAALVYGMVSFCVNSVGCAQGIRSEAIDNNRVQIPSDAILPAPPAPTQLQFQSPVPNASNFIPPSTSGDQLLERVEFVQTPMEEALRLFSKEANMKIVASEAARNLPVTVTIRDMTAILALKELTRQSNTFYKLDRATGVYTVYAESERDKNAWDPDSLRLFEQEVNEAFPDSIVRLTAVGRQLLVRGQAHDVVEASRIIRLIDAEAKSKKVKTADEQTRTTTQVNQSGGLFSGVSSFLQTSEPELTVIDMLTVTGDQQVSLRVTVAEVDRNAARQIGLNFGIKDAGNSSIFQSLIGSTNEVTQRTAVGTPLVSGGTLPTLLDNGQIQLAINALRRMSLAKTLAEPTLTSMNGQQASFQVGGQFPIPVISGLNEGGLQGVTYVPFGVNLKFTPYISDRDRIRLKVSAEVSNRGESTIIGGNVDNGGTVVPGLDMRKFETVVELRETQTLAVAGLITHSQNNQADRVPFFGDLPIVGRLAALDRISSREQELVILVTPELVRALDPEERPHLPGTDIFEPGDVEFYLGARLEGNRNEDFRSAARTDLQRQQSFYNHRDVFIVGPHGYTECGPQPGVFQ